jgi:hypothetical protein
MKCIGGDLENFSGFNEGSTVADSRESSENTRVFPVGAVSGREGIVAGAYSAEAAFPAVAAKAALAESAAAKAGRHSHKGNLHL